MPARAGIGIHSVGMTALMWKCLPNTTRKELTTTPWFSNMKLGRAHARGAEPPAAMQHPLLLSYAAGESEGRGQDTVATRIDDFQVGVVQERSQSYHSYMVEAIKLVERMLGTSIATWDRGAYDMLWFRFCEGLWDCKGNNF